MLLPFHIHLALCILLGEVADIPQFVWALALARVESCEPCSHHLVSCSEFRNQNVCATKIVQHPVMLLMAVKEQLWQR